MVRGALAAFNKRDFDAVLALLHPEVSWPNLVEGGRIRTRAAIRAYWDDQLAIIGVLLDPHELVVLGDNVTLLLHQTILDLDGVVIAELRVRGRFELKEGLIVRFDVGGGPAMGPGDLPVA